MAPNVSKFNLALGLKAWAAFWLTCELVATSTTAFSTISSSRVQPALSKASSARGAAHESAGWRENSLTSNYVTAVEDNSAGARAMLVATTDHNYAIFSPALIGIGWQSVTVNGDQIFVLTTWNKTFSSRWTLLDEQQRDFISEARSNLTQNLAGLRFAHYTSGSSISPRGRPSGGGEHLDAYGHKTQLGSMSLAGQSVADSMIERMGEASGKFSQFLRAGHRVHANDSRHRRPLGNRWTSAKPEDDPDGGRPPVQGADLKAEPRPPKFHKSSKGSSTQDLLEANELPSSAASFFSSRGIKKANDSSSGGTSTTGTSASKMRSLPRYGQLPAVAGEHLVGAAADQTGPVADALLASKSLCSATRYLDSFNYYNLNSARLNSTLAGDVYFFDFHCNVLDVYSTSVSLRQLVGLSLLYRNPNYFSFTRSNLPLAINRIFLVDEMVFFIYNDGSLLLKANWQLEKLELDIVLYVRQKLKLIDQWQSRAADLVGRSKG